MCIWRRSSQSFDELSRRDDLDGKLAGINSQQVEIAGDDRFGTTRLGKRNEIVVSGIATHGRVGTRGIDQQGGLPARSATKRVASSAETYFRKRCRASTDVISRKSSGEVTSSARPSSAASRVSTGRRLRRAGDGG